MKRNFLKASYKNNSQEKIDAAESHTLRKFYSKMRHFLSQENLTLIFNEYIHKKHRLETLERTKPKLVRIFNSKIKYFQ